MNATLEAPKTEIPVAEVPPAEKTRELLGKMNEAWMGRKATLEKSEKPVPKPKVEAKQPAPVEPEKKPEEPKAGKPAEKSLEKAPEKSDDGSRVADAVSKAVRDVGTVVRDALATRQEPKPEPKDTFKLPAAEEKRQKNLATLEKLFPEDYRGIATERAAFLDRQRRYEQKWMEENPNKDFDPDAEEHNEFFAQDPINNVQSEHLAEAIAEQRVQEERSRVDERLAESEKRNRVIPLAERESATLAARMAQEVGGKESAGLVHPDGSINDDRYREMLEADPLRAPIIASAAHTVRTIVGEAVKIFNDAAAFEPHKNQAHAELDRIWRGAEAKLSELDASAWDKSDTRGRKLENFVPYETFYQMPPSRRAGKWSLDEADLKEIVAMQVREDAKKSIQIEEDRLNSFAKKRGYQMSSDKKAPEGGSDKIVKEAVVTEEKPNSPSSFSEPKMAGIKGATQNGNAKFESILSAAWMGRK